MYLQSSFWEMDAPAHAARRTPMDEYDAHPSEGILPESGCTAESEGEAIVYAVADLPGGRAGAAAPGLRARSKAPQLCI
jgi:hypothetical protein